MNSMISPEVSAYLDRLVPVRDPVLARMEARAEESNFPIIGPAAGQLFYLIARLVDARKVFELGSGFGYSTAWFARAVRENGGGSVHHTVWEEDLSRDAREYLTEMGLADLVHFEVSEAIAALSRATEEFDLIFNDIDKRGYPAALDVIEEKLKPGGVLIIDNMLWHGRIFDHTDASEDTAGVREFTERIANDPRWSASLVPIRDGLIVARWNR